MAITDREASNAKPGEKDYKIRDRDNMYLTVTKKGVKYWRMDYRHEGRRKTITFGKYPNIGLKKARAMCQDAKDNLGKGIDPKRKNNASITKKETVLTFEKIGMEWFEVKMHGKSESHRSRSLRLLEKDLFPKIGGTPVEELHSSVLLKALRKIEDRGVIDTAHRANQVAGQVFDYAIACGHVEINPARPLTKALKPKTEIHYPAITDPVRTGQLMLAIDAYTGTAVVRAALKLSALFFLRPGELRTLEWNDVNFEDRLILIPSYRMKIKMDHLVPLCSQSIKLLSQLHNATGHGKYIFPSPRGGSRPLSENAVRTALRTLGYDNQTMVPHGFRAMARTLLDEELEFNIVWIEQQLAHVVKDTNGRAYNRTKHLRQRREMMQRWADYLDELKAKASGQG